MKKTKALNQDLQGTLKWKMYESHDLASVSWKDKRLVILISSHAMPIDDLESEKQSYVLRKNGANCELVPTSPMHLKYTTFMCRVDVANQM